MTKEHPRVRAANREKEKVALRLEKLATLRLDDWHEQHPYFKHVSITFGNGTELVQLAGVQYCSWQDEKYPILKSLFDAIRDVWDITDGYHLACPEDWRSNAHP
jgi:hypothetical protein